MLLAYQNWTDKDYTKIRPCLSSFGEPVPTVSSDSCSLLAGQDKTVRNIAL